MCEVGRVLKEAIEDGKSKADLEAFELLYVHSLHDVPPKVVRQRRPTTAVCAE